MHAQQPSDDELLESSGWSRRARAALAFGVLVVAVGVVIGLTRGGHDSPPAQLSSAPDSLSTSGAAPLPTGNDVVVQGLSYGVGTAPTAGHSLVVTASAALVNRTDRTYSVLYPISVDGIDKAVSVDAAEVAADDMNSALLAPEPLTMIRAGRQFEVWLELRIACGAGKVSFRRATVSIALQGTSTPAVFRFADLFGSELRPHRRPC